jgi:hypothetical protein
MLKLVYIVTTAMSIAGLLLQGQGCATKPDSPKVRQRVVSERQMLRQRESEGNEGSRYFKVQQGIDLEQRIRTLETKQDIQTGDLVRQLGEVREAAVGNVKERQTVDLVRQLGEIREAVGNVKERLRTLTQTLLQEYQVDLEGRQQRLQQIQKIGIDLGASENAAERQVGR